jgi:SPP1 family predicted phage head-tail adaptor
MRAGDLDRLVTIQSRSTTQSSSGAVSEVFTTIAEAWAKVKDLRGDEVASARAVNANVTTRITMRYRDDVDELSRILWNGRIYDVKSVAEIGRREVLEILAEAKTS